MVLRHACLVEEKLADFRVPGKLRPPSITQR